MHDSRNNADVTLQLIALLGDTLARVQAAHAKEEYALSQIVASLKFVNHTVDSWVNSSQEEAESSQFHVYESDLHAVSKSIDAVLGEARLVRGSSKRANPKGATSTPDNAIAHKSKVAEQKKKTLERFSQALHIRPTKTVSTDLGDRHSSFSAAHEMLLRWMECNSQRSFHIVAKQKREKSVERSNPARRFLDSLWTIRGSPAVSETKVGDAPAGDLMEITSENDGSNTAPPAKQVEAVRHRVQKNVEELQALCKLIDQRHLHSELLSPHMTISNAFERDRYDVGNEEESAEGSSWLPARTCWRILGTQGKEIMTGHEMQVLPTLYSHVQRGRLHDSHAACYKYLRQATFGNNAIDALHPHKHLPLPSPVGACPMLLPQIVISISQEISLELPGSLHERLLTLEQSVDLFTSQSHSEVVNVTHSTSEWNSSFLTLLNECKNPCNHLFQTIANQAKLRL